MLTLLLVAVITQGPAESPRISKLKWKPVVDLPVTGALGLGWLISEFAVKSQLAPSRCRWCVTNELDNSFRSLFRPEVGLSGSSIADDVSNVTWVSSAILTLGIQALLAARDDSVHEMPVDIVLILQATFAAMVFNQTVKFVVARERPFVGQLLEQDKPLTHRPNDNNLAFFSGHATFTMAIAVATGTVTRLRGYRLGWLVWAVAVPLSLATGMLRIAADKHSLSDVAIGWMVGAGIGFGIPWLFHNVENPIDLRLVPAAGGIALAGRF